MKKNKLVAFLCAAVFASVAVAETGAEAGTQAAVALAADSNTAMESVCKAVANAVAHDTLAPSEVFVRVASARSAWTAAQVAGLYKSILLASPELSASFVSDLDAFEEAGKPTTVAADVPEGVKLLAALYAMELPGVSADVVLASVVADTVGSFGVRSVSPLRDVKAGTVRRSQPVKPTPPAASVEN